ncbi:MAG: hypothetical protein ACK559_03065, partial [bacterium]
VPVELRRQHRGRAVDVAVAAEGRGRHLGEAEEEFVVPLHPLGEGRRVLPRHEARPHPLGRERGGHADQLGARRVERVAEDRRLADARPARRREDLLRGVRVAAQHQEVVHR